MNSWASFTEPDSSTTNTMSAVASIPASGTVKSTCSSADWPGSRVSSMMSGETGPTEVPGVVAVLKLVAGSETMTGARFPASPDTANT